MNNTDNSPNDEKQQVAVPTDCRALLAMTCPLIITEHSLPSWRGGETGRSGFGLSPELGDWRAESTLRRGEIFGSDEPGCGTTENEELATTTEEGARNFAPEIEDAALESVRALRRRNSNLRIRVYLGMS
jgi:hypothetical protein